MANLPSNTFMFNYNAKNYDPSTYTIPKTEGQLFAQNIVLNTEPESYDDTSIYFGNKQSKYTYIYDNSNLNPFERHSPNNSFTFIYKTSGFTSSSTNLFANRYGGYNYMVRGSMLHTSQSGFLNLAPNTSPEICVIRVNSDGSCERKFVDENGITLRITTSSSITWGGSSRGVGFFCDVQYGEYFANRFYWMYCSMETLTDAEVLKVIQFNENTKTFELSTDSLTYSYSGGSQNVIVTSDNPWTASTTDSWITISSSTGDTGETTVIVTVGSTILTNRTGTVTFTDGEDTLTLTVNQTKYDGFPINKLYINGDRIN